MDIQSLFSLEGRIALVTGGSRGIGKMFVEGLLAAGCARVYISARKLDQMDSDLAGAAPAAPKPPAKDEQLEARKRQAEAAEEAKRKAEDLRIAQLRADNCERAKRAKATLDSGVRIATTNAKGEREIMDDNARNAETKRLNEIAQKDCGPAPARQQAQ